MLDSIWARLLIVLAIIGLIKWAHYEVKQSGINECTAENVTAVNDAVAKDRLAERKKQDKVDEGTQKQINAIGRINVGLINDLNKLRNRPNRKQPSSSTESSCKGATGADLSGEDAEFLVGEAARADTIRVGLEACYEYESIISNKQGEQ